MASRLRDDVPGNVAAASRTGSLTGFWCSSDSTERRIGNAAGSLRISARAASARARPDVTSGCGFADNQARSASVSASRRASLTMAELSR
jgi:hypothetical protein